MAVYRGFFSGTYSLLPYAVALLNVSRRSLHLGVVKEAVTGCQFQVLSVIIRSTCTSSLAKSMVVPGGSARTWCVLS